MSGGSYSQTQDADQTAALCDDSIIPIFPVRYALKGETLLSLNSSIREISSPSSIASLAGSDHELTRIRQGFFYIFVPLSAENGSDEKGVWHVFRYETLVSEDENSNHEIPFTETNLHRRYQFYKYNWIDGYAHGEWEADRTQVYPYAFVPLNTSKIEVAYCETRWPGHFFCSSS